MIDYTAIREAIETIIGTGFTTIPVVFENTRKNPLNSPHVAVTIDDTSSDPIEMGTVKSQVTGICTVQIYTALGLGTNLARTYASSITTLLNNSGENIFFGVPELRSVGPVEGLHLYQHNLTVTYSYIYGQND
jgi:hypothetical protein